ncbi:MAG: hypothetical protein IRZ32_09430 [Solirubrobacteraceae bacterium]|nr:hypothetical protein [Solirubrobacteraceae bacterium]
MRRASPLILALALALLALPGLAHASAADVIRDCTLDGRLDRAYTQKELRSALANLPSDVDEYTNCRDVIRAAQLAAGSGGGADGGGGTGTAAPGTGTGGAVAPAGTGGAAAEERDLPGAFGGFDDVPEDPAAAATPEEREAIEEVAVSPRAAQATQLAGTPLPAPVVAALAAGGLALLILLALDLRRRVADRHG